jgi:hypothetical protein
VKEWLFMARLTLISASAQLVSSPSRLRALFTKCDDNFTELYGYASTAAAAVTATTGGATTGLIPATANFVTVTSDSANKQISLPAATIGKQITIQVGATACELISSVAADKLNNVTVGATNEAALTANNTYLLQYVAANTWIMTGWTNLGAVQTAVIPDAL